VGSRPKLILCEGEHEINILRKLFQSNYRVLDRKDKENVFRSGYTALGNSIVLVNEGGKSNLESNILMLCSKLRSIWYEYRVDRIDILAIIDSDHGDPNSVFGDILSKINNLLSDPRKFPKRKPAIKLSGKVMGFSHLYRIDIDYYGMGELSLNIFIIPHSLEYWVNKHGYSTFEYLIKTQWFEELVEVLRKELNIEIKGSR